MKNSFGQVIECRLVGNINDEKRDEEIKRANEKGKEMSRHENR